MQTNFTSDQRARPEVREMESILRKCVHCGFCLSDCPTYSILGDERDSPRGRIYLIKELIESDGKSAKFVMPHLDKCLSCLACTSVCPSGVDYQHYVDFARSYIEPFTKRTIPDRFLRWFLARTIPNPHWFRLSLVAASLLRPISGLLGRRIKSVIKLSPKKIPLNSTLSIPQSFPAVGKPRLRVALLAGCAQQVLRPSINEATIRLLNRLGCEVVLSKGIGCCGALVNHMGRQNEAREFAKANITSWNNEIEERGLDAIVVNTSGCGTEVKGYSHLFKNDEIWHEMAERISFLTKDITELLTEIDFPTSANMQHHTIVYHDACSLLHGQKIEQEPRLLLKSVGFDVKEIPGKHFCCGSAGVYNLIQTEIAEILKFRRLEAIEKIEAEIVATGNIGCQVQLQTALKRPVVHTVELLDWATGGPSPPGT